MIDDKISQSMGVRSIAETQTEETVSSNPISGTTRGLGSDREQSETVENRQQSMQVHAEPELEKTAQTEGSSEATNDFEVTKGALRSVEHHNCGTPDCCGECDTATTVPVVINSNKENLEDIELAKSNVQNIIEMGDDAVREMVAIAKQSESPRAFEVVSTLMKTLLDANKEYVEMSSKKKLVQDEEQYGRPETNVTNNNLIVSTADLLSMIKGEGNANN